MQLHAALEEKKIDKRLQDKLLAEGKVSKDELNKQFKHLPDDEKNSEILEIIGRTTRTLRY